ncbi:MAG TPA: Zn-ribbon domain-containing OB-fold protein [Dehalococcoidia bacterium]|nr:Zn-ribbon domain-containing OB-fold protein [Dehalococcoidia bacterium]
MTYRKPLPQPNADTKPFWDGCKQHQLRFQKCRDCQYVRWPPSIICPRCHSQDTEWIVASGRGRVYTFAVYHQAFHESFREDLPYITAIIELEEGPHLLSNIVGCNPREVKCDMPVEVVWEDITEEFTLPKFRIATQPDVNS